MPVAEHLEVKMERPKSDDDQSQAGGGSSANSLRMPAKWSILEMLLAVCGVIVFFHAFRSNSASDWECYLAALFGAMVLIVCGVGFMRRTNRWISAFSASLGLMVFGHAVGEITAAFMFTGHLP
jgi:predicted membrane protein